MANASDILQLRRRIGDRQRSTTETFNGDGATLAFNLQYSNVWGITVDDNDDATFTVNEGVVTFATAPDEGDEFNINYNYAAYTDDELGADIDQFGLDVATLECLYELMADASRLFDYTSGNREQSKSQVFSNINKMVTLWEGKVNAAAAAIPTNSVSMGRRARVYPRNTSAGDGDLTRDDSFLV